MTTDDRAGGPPREIAIEQGGGKPQIINCPACGAENIQGADSCTNCGSDLRTLDIPPETWSPGEGPPGTPVGELCRREALEVKPTTTVREAVALMRDAGQGCVVVVEDGRVVGVFTERDVLNTVSVDRQSMTGRSMTEVMTPDPVVLEEGESVLVAINKMSIGGFRHIPVVDERRALRGILSGRDILQYVDAVAEGSR